MSRSNFFSLKIARFYTSCRTWRQDVTHNLCSSQNFTQNVVLHIIIRNNDTVTISSCHNISIRNTGFAINTAFTLISKGFLSLLEPWTISWYYRYINLITKCKTFVEINITSRNVTTKKLSLSIALIMVRIIYVTIISANISR